MAPEQTPMTEEQLRAAVIGELQTHDATIVLADYDPEWPRLFEREAERIRGALGDKALQIEHVGSTSVPGLAAKPVIDIVLVVADSADEGSYLPPLEAAGYVLRIREPDLDEHRMFTRPDTRIHLHVFSQGCGEIGHMVDFRDRLRENESDRELYERIKRDLARKEWKYVQNYADAKTEVIGQILARTGGSA